MQFRATVLLETDDNSTTIDDVESLIRDLLFDMDDFKIKKIIVREIDE